MTSAVTSSGDRRSAHWSDAAGVERVMAVYEPEALHDADPAIVAEVMRATRVWVALAGPHDALSARQMIWAVAPMAVWLLQTSGSLDVTMFDPRNVEVWINTFNRHQTRGWRHLARTCLRRVGRAANPDGWPQPKAIGRSPIAPPYTGETEAVFGQVAEIPRPEGDQPGRLWVAAGGCGGALNGVELSAAETGDLEERGNGRLVIKVRGHGQGGCRFVPSGRRPCAKQPGSHKNGKATSQASGSFAPAARTQSPGSQPAWTSGKGV